LSTDWPAGYDRIVLPEIDSTNAEAARRAPGLTGPTWILALHQTAARGRRGRPWMFPRGNFAATLVLRPAETPDKVALRSFVASLALCDAFADATGTAAPFALKWPNDVLLNGGKVAGILLESLVIAPGAAQRALAIGIGVNLAAAPAPAEVEPGALPPVSLAAETGAQVTPQALLNHLAARYAEWETRFTTYGFAPIRTAWLARATRLGTTITARTGTETLTGVFETIDTAGNLVLSTSGARRAIPAADIFF
jgi:BirA family biotin operon repressor/biotin-[acetyl-CoA-carboxylase] ligase